jgi:hypothetical protein
LITVKYYLQLIINFRVVPGLMRTSLSFRHKNMMQVIWMLNINFGIVQFLTVQERNFWIWCKWIRNFSDTMPHSLLSCGKSWRTRYRNPSESDCQVWSFLISWTQITYQQYPICWITLKWRIFQDQSKNSQTGNGFKSLPMI